MEDVYKKSLELHREKKGKLEVVSKIKIEDKESLSLAYTPGVAEVCREIARDKSQVFSLTIKENTVAVVSDGSAILGLGNLGPEAAIPVMEGKCALFKEFAGVDAFPICLDTQDSEEIIKAVKLIAPVFGGINLEDISAPRCFEIENRLKSELDIPVMHDDQHGTAVVVLAGLINSLKLRGLNKEETRIVISGAGAAGTAVASLLSIYGFSDIVVCDTQGAIYQARPGISPEKFNLASITNPRQVKGGFKEALEGAHIFIGVSKPELLTPEMVKTMAEKPIIFALSNPVPEITPELAYEAGAFIVSTGRSDYPNQVNNVLAFPGIFKGALRNRVKQITDKMLIRSALVLASMVEAPSTDMILPNPLNKEIPEKIAREIID